MDSFELKTSSGTVPIQFSASGFAWVAGEIDSFFHARRPRILIVTDENVALHYLAESTSALTSSGFDCTQHVLPPGEEQKNTVRLNEILDALAINRFARDDLIVALGGGVVTDIAGFAASVYQRGIAWVAVPTSLLGMVDAAIGGKTGINHPLGKNLIGAFHQPSLVLAPLAALETLPQRDLLAGAAEIVKSALIAGGEFWQQIELAGPNALLWTPEQVRAFATKAAFVKIGIVERDERESGERILLNLGHSFGHALEHAAGYGTLLHGEAVFYGLRATVWMSLYTETLHPKRADELLGWLSKLPLPAVVCDSDALLNALQADKKAAERSLRWILLQDAGRAIVLSNISSEVVAECANWLCSVVKHGTHAAQPKSQRKLRVLVINGPNLNLLGQREPAVYGTATYEDLLTLCSDAARELGLDVMVRQSNHEGEFVDLLQWGRRWADAFVLNPGGFTHSSVAIRDALAAANLPAVEVHISDPEAREPFRHDSLIRDLCRATVKGEGIHGYRWALDRVSQLVPETSRPHSR